MKIENVKKIEKKEIPISIRTTKINSKFMKDNKLSPNKIFALALEDLKKEK